MLIFKGVLSARSSADLQSGAEKEVLGWLEGLRGELLLLLHREDELEGSQGDL